MKPDYGGASLVNLMASIAQGCGGTTPHVPLKTLGPEELREARNVVLFIIDGLGDHYLRSRGGGGELLRCRRGAITSVFPSTTATAITTTYTGATPLEHGLTGWFTYFGQAGCVGAPLPFMVRGEQRSLRARGVTPATLFTAPPLFDALGVACHVVSSSDIVESQYNQRYCAAARRWPYVTTQELVAQVARAARSGPERKFIYAYWPHYDRVSHHHGSLSERAFAELGKIDAAFGDTLRALAGTESIVIATADHGFVDVAPEESLELPASLAARLRFPLCGERRVAYCHAHEPQAFMREAQDWLGERAEVLPSRELVAQGWFGPGAEHARFDERVGDVTLLMRGRYTIKDWSPGEARFMHIGNHGGTSAEEMTIPLVVAAT
jgi:hypothetical protein